MSRLLRPYGYVYSYQPLDAEANFPKFVGAGLLIASKWPIVKKDSVVFKKIVKTTSDYLATKGALYVAIQKGQKVYHIFNTHLQATDSSKAKRVRLEQTKELKLFKDRLEIPQHDPVIFAGDFNEDYWTQTGECGWVPLLFKASSSGPNGITINYKITNRNAEGHELCFVLISAAFEPSSQDFIDPSLHENVNF